MPNAQSTAGFVVGLYCLTVPCCALPAVICLIGVGVGLGQGLYTGDDIVTSRFVLLKPEEETNVGFRKFRLVEIQPKTWELDRGEIALGSLTLTEVEVGASTIDGLTARSATTEGEFHELKYANKFFAVVDPDSDDLHKITGFGGKLTFCILGFFVVKVYKYFLLYATMNPWIDDGVPTKLYEFYFNLDDHEGWKTALNIIWILVDFVLLTWGPNLGILPLSSIRSDEKFQNLATMSYEPDLWASASYGIILGGICWIILVIADSRHKEEPWDWETERLPKICLLIPRTVLLAVMVASVVTSVITFSVNLRLLIGIDLSIIFSFSLRFGLVAWASFLRFFLFWMSFFELLMTIAVTFIMKADSYSGGMQRIGSNVIGNRS